MELGPHATFIIGAYAACALVIAALIGWVVVDHRGQLRILSALDKQGVARRSASQRREAA